VTELERWQPAAPVDLVFGGLIFEYTRLDEALAAVSAALVPGGRLVALLQVPASTQQTVTPSAYAQAMSVVIGFFQYIAPDDFERAAARHGLRALDRRQRTLPSGKGFAILGLEKPRAVS
jgi:hypothetical protein